MQNLHDIECNFMHFYYFSESWEGLKHFDPETPSLTSLPISLTGFERKG